MSTRPAPKSRVALLSPRNLMHEVWRGYHYEFENIICEIDNVDLIAPGARRRSKIERVLRQKAKEWASVIAPAPKIERQELDGRYDLFFAVMVGLPDLDLLESCEGWRERSTVAGCWIDEIWLRDLGTKQRLKALESFDFVFVACQATVPTLEQTVRRPCNYIAPAVDALSFCPYPNPPERSIDILSIGRRNEANHRALIDLARRQQLHYVFDSAPIREVHDLFDHRLLLASQIQRSRFFCVDVAKVNLPKHRARQEEMGYRFFEGAAGGALLVGRAPRSSSFEKNFDWPNSVIGLPDSASRVAEFFAEYAESDRTDRIRRDNIVNCLRRHDWVYRWQAVLDAAEMDRLRPVDERRSRLTALAESVEMESGQTRRSDLSS